MQPHDEPSDGELVRRYCDGEAAAFEALYKRHEASLRAVLSRDAAGRSHAEDACQIAWTNLSRSILKGRYEEQGAFRSYLFQLGRNALLDCRRKNRKPHQPLAEDPPAPTIDSGPDPAIAALQQCIDELPEKLRRAVRASKLDGIESSEAAQLMGFTVGTIYKLVHEAMKRLKKCVSGKLGVQS